MRILLTLLVLAFIPIVASAQVKGAGIVYATGALSHSVNQNTDAEMGIDTATGLHYEYSRDGLGWILAGFRVQKFAFGIAPTAAPQDKQSEILLNDVDSLYRWRGGAWRHVNKSGAGVTDLTFTGSGPYTLNSSTGTDVTLTQAAGMTMVRTVNDLSFAAIDASATNELQTFASTSNATSHTLTLSNSGGSLQYIEGTGISLTTGGTGLDGTVTIASTLTGESTDARNGLSMSGLFVELGGTGLQNTSIAWAAFSWTNTWNTLAGTAGLLLSSTSTAAASNNQKLVEIALSGANATASQTTYGLVVANTHTGTTPTNYGIFASVTGGTSGAAISGSGGVNIGVEGLTSSGLGVNGSASSGTGGLFSSSTGTALSTLSSNSTVPSGIIANNSAANTAVTEALRVASNTTGVAGNGIGVKVSLRAEVSDGTSLVANELISKWTNATVGSRTSEYIITGVNSTTLADLFTLSGSGALKLNKYGIGTFTGTPAFSLDVDASGNLIESAVSALTGSGQTDRVTIWSSATNITHDAAYTVDPVNDRMTITGTVAGLGANAAFLNLNSGALGAGTTFLRASGNISSNMVAAEFVNANNATTAANTMAILSVGGAAAGDPIIQFAVSGVVTHNIGTDNTDSDKFKLTMNGATPGVNGNDGFVWTNNAPPRYGINVQPLHPLDVLGTGRMTQFRMTGNLWDNTMIAFGTGAGTGPTVNSISGGNNGFQINFTTGTTPTADGIIFTGTYPNSYGSLTYPVIWGRGNPGGLNWLAEQDKFNIDSAGAANFVLKARGTLTASTQYAINVVIMGY